MGNKQGKSKKGPKATRANALDGVDVFLSHNWGKDEKGRDNHARVKKINTLLKARGVTTWFDEGDMAGNIMQAMAKGIEGASIVLVFVTRAYIEKIKKAEGNDNCQLEFDYAYNRKTKGKMVPVVMEHGCSNPASWDGMVGAALASKLYIGMQDDTAVKQNIEALVAEVRRVQGNSGNHAGACTSPQVSALLPLKIPAAQPVWWCPVEESSYSPRKSPQAKLLFEAGRQRSGSTQEVQAAFKTKSLGVQTSLRGRVSLEHGIQLTPKEADHVADAFCALEMKSTKGPEFLALVKNVKAATSDQANI